MVGAGEFLQFTKEEKKREEKLNILIITRSLLLTAITLRSIAVGELFVLNK